MENWLETATRPWPCTGGCSVDDEEATKDAVDEDLEEGELPDDDEETDEKEEDEKEVSEIVDPPAAAAAAIPSLLDMKISRPPNGKTCCSKHSTAVLISLM